MISHHHTDPGEGGGSSKVGDHAQAGGGEGAAHVGYVHEDGADPQDLLLAGEEGSSSTALCGGQGPGELQLTAVSRLGSWSKC